MPISYIRSTSNSWKTFSSASARRQSFTTSHRLFVRSAEVGAGGGVFILGFAFTTSRSTELLPFTSALFRQDQRHIGTLVDAERLSAREKLHPFPNAARKDDGDHDKEETGDSGVKVVIGDF